jgi:hypothetical protein
VRRIVQGVNVRPKLRIGAVDDPAEHEAERVANQVTRMTDRGNEVASPDVSMRSGAEPVRRLCADCEQDLRRQPAEDEGRRREDEVEEIPVRRQAADEDELVEAKQAPGKAPASSSASAATIQALRGGGSPLPAAERAFFEPRFGRSFEDVRIHTGADADHAARSINARAFTFGHDVAFAGGEYGPGSSQGRHLLAHELTHVVQNSTGKDERDLSVRRMARGAAGGSPRANFVVVPNDETARVDAAIAIIERMKNDRANYPGCHRFFTDNCTGGTRTSFIDAVDAAVVWKRDPNPEGWNGSTHDNTQHIAYTRVPYDNSRWAIAATLVHELMHTCGQNDHDIGDQAKHACGRLPNI